MQRVILLTALAVLGACTPGDSISRDTQPFAGISDNETVTVFGTEPFWNIEIEGSSAAYTAPETPDPTTFEVERFAGNNGLGYSGELSGQAVQIAVTPGDCSDGMSDRTYPFTATVTWGDATLYGCAYTNVQGFTGDEAP